MEKFNLCIHCVFNNGTDFCGAERCTDKKDHEYNECDCFVADLGSDMELWNDMSTEKN